MRLLQVQNRQRVVRLRPAKLKAFATAILEALEIPSYECGVQVVGAAEMAGLNEQFLRHRGSTDVITFDHGSSPDHLHGEIFVCIDDARKQASEFKTTWQSEIGRYTAHGFLHLLGYDDLSPAKRKLMKSRENALMRDLESHPALAQLAYE
jgi:probable rRNA maturation factor